MKKKYEFTPVLENIEGVQDFVKIVKYSADGLYYVGMNFQKGGLLPFACSPSYRTINGAVRFAKKRYAA